VLDTERRIREARIASLVRSVDRARKAKNGRRRFGRSRVAEVADPSLLRPAAEDVWGALRF